MAYIDEKELYNAIQDWIGDNDMYGVYGDNHDTEDALIRKIDRLPRVEAWYIMSCDTCRANKVCNHRKYGIDNCGSYIPIEVPEKALA